MQSTLTPLTFPPSQQSIAPTQRSIASPPERSASSPPQRSTSNFRFQLSDSDTEIFSPPSTCYTKNQKLVKGGKSEPIERAFFQINTTLNTLAAQICSKKNLTSDDDDPDVLIGKLVTAELKRSFEPRKSVLRKRLMDMFYTSEPVMHSNQ